MKAAALIVAIWVGAAAAPARAAAPLDRGIALYRQGQVDAALAVFAQAIRAQPRQVEPRLWLGIGLVEARRYRDAAQALEAAAALAPRDARIWLWWGHALAMGGEGGRARRVLEHVLILAPRGQVAELARQALRGLHAPTLTTQPALPADAEAEANPALHPTTYARLARFYNPRLSDHQAQVIAAAIVGYSRQYRLDPRLVAAVIAIESGFSPTALSHKGAMGLGQLMPATAAALGVYPYDPVQNIYGTVRVLRGHLDHFGWENPNLALAAYNAGKGAVERHRGIPPYVETALYVRGVGNLYLRFLEIYRVPGGRKV